MQGIGLLSGNPPGHVPRSPRTAIDACAIRRMLSCCVYQKGNNLSSKGQYTTTNKSYVVKLVII
ncbi:TPA: hypothetical protein MJE31_00180 [Klebsiella pneumoniae]|nr:hypothetical protein [Klebsiella pneumoniae]HBZ0974742.1 hypothetical protein [Klebsiella pneumoniae]HBZ0980584.1 hypothetical protein [Klebsiella pneumoniae]HBZ1077399.1 hypothetical protein [Klebsiella pneumoniae]HBZ1155737.1 hypothetical protein [Klebsiella pneumoniae]